ncbi:10 kDa chaperonin (macronuclear) [Tetrahymena thermophila SB210]|uniref:10 kDa chaperonin n=1 Tax=Tetrahymena thermophila (strain SB210) TaxID=312017 RepID=Q23AS6_TETTS|nr:10 kDa chaperonin [Tetrahymena thermophila SB210]EAR93616.1 10 kDa chaperonin [Tetrahymena thermophila SB210]|eukprot:XP_001013861.1 10 kDa chaperonin [Tetrahymena thermophila SB210]
MTSVFKRLVPTFNRILVKKFEAETKTRTGIILQDPADKTAYGEIVSAGPGNFDNNGKVIPLGVKVGDIVVLPDYGGSKINLKDGEFFVYRDTDILGVLHKN